MKATLIVAAALLSTAAWAQETAPASSSMTTPNAANAASAPATATNPDAPAPGTSPADQSSSDVTGSNAAMPNSGAGMNAMPTSGNAQAVPDASASADTSNYPACSRAVTDKCVQRGAWHKGHRRG